MEYRQTTLRFTYPFGETSAILAEPENSDSSSIVILCHGFLSNKESRTNLRLTQLLASHGLSTLRFDWFGMGQSSGDFADITISVCRVQLQSLFKDLNARGYRKIGLIGSSFGGLVTILVTPEHQEVCALGLKCPVPDFPEMLELEFGKEELARWQATNTIPNVSGGKDRIALHYTFYTDCLEFSAYDQAKHIQVPCLIVHGAHDELVPLQQIYRLMEHIKGTKDLLLLPQANHQFGRPEDFRVMSLALTQWMVRHLTSSTALPPVNTV